MRLAGAAKNEGIATVNGNAEWHMIKVGIR